jgi:hypothetical protein
VKDLDIQEDYETVERRLHAFPKGLDNYFKFMMDRLDPFHQTETAQIFSLADTVVRHDIAEVPLLALQYLNKLKNSSFPLQELKPLDDVQAKNIEKLWRDRLYARCGDLLRIIDGNTAVKNSNGINRQVVTKITFLHRTVADYVTENSDSLYRYLSSEWNPIYSLIRLYLALLKSRPLCWQHWAAFLHSTEFLDRSSRLVSSDVLAEFERTISPSDQKNYLRDLLLSQELTHTTFGEADALLPAYVYYRLYNELEHRLKVVGCPAPLHGNREYLLYAHLRAGNLDGKDSDRFDVILRLVLETGADANYEIFIMDPASEDPTSENSAILKLLWIYFVENSRRIGSNFDKAGRWKAVQTLIQYGARLSAARITEIEILEAAFGVDRTNQLLLMMGEKEITQDGLANERSRLEIVEDGS